jgi:thiosulfate/3-mercaptopyruvate sulfurtransferase
MNRIFLVTVVFVLATMGTSFGFGSSKFKDEVEKEQGAIKLVREVQKGGYEVISTSELKEMMASDDDLLIIDTMPFEASYKKNHIPGAEQFLFPIPDMMEWNSQDTAGKSKEDYLKLLGPDKTKKIVVYCGFVKCTRSHNGALWAKQLGYEHVYRYPGGIFAWKGAGYEVAEMK